jgi:hypothetical protein
VTKKRELAKRRGPKTPAGKLTVSRNATTHGIMSPRPVVAHFETEQAWQRHREAIVDSLGPEGGMEEALAERVALCSWRLNRVTVFETQSIALEQEAVIGEVTEKRRRALHLSSVFKHEAKEILAGSMFEGMIDLDAGQRLSELAIESLAPAEVPLEAAANKLGYYESVEALFDAAPDATIDAGWIFDEAPSLTMGLVFHQEDEAAGLGEDDLISEEEENERDERIAVLREKFWQHIDGVDSTTITVEEVKDHLCWLVEEAGVRPLPDVDGRVSSTPVVEDLMEKMHTLARYEYQKALKAAKAVEEEVTKKRRARILPDELLLRKIAKYEAHLSRQMYQALHELEALQARRASKAAPLARVELG